MIDDPDNIAKADEIYAVVSRDEEGFEGIVGIAGPDGTPMPAIVMTKYLALDMHNRIFEASEKELKKSKKTLHVIEFTRKGEVDTSEFDPSMYPEEQ